MAPPPSTRFSVSASGTPRTAPSTPGVGRGIQAGRDIRRPHEGPGGVMDGDEVGRLAGQRFQAVEHGLLAARAAHDGRRQVEAGDGGS